MHDGRADSLEAAVRLPDGQAGPSSRRFFKLSRSERQEVKAFLNSLIAPASLGAPGVVSAAEAEVQFKSRGRSSEPSGGVPAKDASRRDAKLNAGRNLKRIGKIQGALEFYCEALRGAPDSSARRQAEERIRVLAAK